MGFRTLAAAPAPDEVLREYHDQMVQLINHGYAMDVYPGQKPPAPTPLFLSDSAHDLWVEFSHEVEREMRPDGKLADHRGWGSKLAGAAARVAGLLHCAAFASNPTAQSAIDSDSMERAIRFCRHAMIHYLLAHASTDARGDIETARRLVRWLKQNPDAWSDGVITARDLWHPHRGTFKRVQDIEGAIRLLIDHNHIAEAWTPQLEKPGRPSRKFRINPALTN